MIELPTSDPRGMAVAEFDTTKLLAKARQQARERNYDELFIVDVDAHHYETESMAEIIDFIEDPVLRQTARSAAQATAKGVGLLPGGVGYQDMGGRITRYPLRRHEKTSGERHRDLELTTRWMDAMGVDVCCLFPTPMLLLSSHPQVEVEVQFARAYNRWLCERILPGTDRLRSMLYLPFNDPEACLRMIEDFGDRKGVCGFMVTASHLRPVHDNAYMRSYAMLEERGLPLSFHASYNWQDRAFAQANRFITVHALGFVFYNMLHLANWVVNGLPERFPRLDVIWIESGLAWVPFLMQRLDNEYMMRSSECPALKMKPSEYMRHMYYSTQPMEVPEKQSVLEATFEMINAETQLLWSSDYPHWDFDLPSVIYDLPFLSHQAKANILGGNAARLFKIERPPCKLARSA